jgi:hypothetical protein
MEIITTINLYQALKDQGFEVPKECREARLVMSAPDEPIMIQFDCFVLGDDLQKIGRALEQLGKVK